MYVPFNIILVMLRQLKETSWIPPPAGRMILKGPTHIDKFLSKKN